MSQCLQKIVGYRIHPDVHGSASYSTDDPADLPPAIYLARSLGYIAIANILLFLFRVEHDLNEAPGAEAPGLTQFVGRGRSDELEF